MSKVGKKFSVFNPGVICLVVGSAFVASSFSSISPATAATFDLTPVSGVDLTDDWKLAS